MSGTFGYIPWVGTDGNPTATSATPGEGLGTVYAGAGLAAAGVATLIAGGIITAIDRRKVKGLQQLPGKMASSIGKISGTCREKRES